MRHSIISVLAAAAVAWASISRPVGLDLPAVGYFNVYSAGLIPEGYFGIDSMDVRIFSDLWKHSSPWYRQECHSHQSDCYEVRRYGFNFGLNDNLQSACGINGTAALGQRCFGYPTALFRSSDGRTRHEAVAYVGEGGTNVRTGQYVLKYTGSGNVSISGINVTYQIASSNRLVVDVPEPTHLKVTLHTTAPSDPVRDIQLVPHTLESSIDSQPFHPEFLALVAGSSALRFAGWQKTLLPWGSPLDAPPRRWDLRTRPEDVQSYPIYPRPQGHEVYGVAVEYMVALANQVGADPWFCMPRPASDTDEYITRFAQYVVAHLNESRKVYVEYCSGVLYSQQDKYKTQQVHQIFEQAFGNASRSRLVRVVSTAFAPTVMEHFGEQLLQVDALAIPGTFGMERSEVPGAVIPFASKDWPTLIQPNSTLQQVMGVVQENVLHAEMETNRLVQRIRGTYRQLRATVAQRQGVSESDVAAADIDVLAFRGGFEAAPDGYAHGATLYSLTQCRSRGTFPCRVYHESYGTINAPSDIDRVWANVTANTALEQHLQRRLIEANAHPLMYDLYVSWLERWRLLGGGTFVAGPLYKPVGLCPTGGKACGANAILTSWATPLEKLHKLRAIRAWRAGNLSTSLPFSGSDVRVSPPAANCTAGCVWGTCVEGKCRCFNGYAGVNCSQLAPKPNDCSQNLGMNVGGVADWSPEWTFVDVFKASRSWISQEFTSYTWNTEAPIDLINTDYPRKLGRNQRVGTMMMRDLRRHGVSGTYVVRYEGDGIIALSMSDIKAVRRAVGRIEVDVRLSTDFNNGMFLTIERTNPSDPIRNIRVTMPGHEHTAQALPFHPWFVHTLAPFKALRFMDWARSNDIQSGRWASRTLPTHRTYAGGVTSPYDSVVQGSTSNTTEGGAVIWRDGVPLEHMVLLANMVGADAWFNIPYNADDDYVRRMAELVRDTLRPDVRVFVEYSNEPWHTGFMGGKWAQQKGLELGLNELGAAWYGGARNEARFCYIGNRTTEISQIWRAAFGSAAVRSRLQIVIATQAGWDVVGPRLLECGQAYKHVDALAVGAYFNGYSSSDRDVTLDSLMTQVLPSAVEGVMNNTIQFNRRLASQYNLSLVAYEAGQHLVGDGSCGDLAMQANRDPRMRGVYKTYLHGLRTGGVDLVMHFASVSHYGRYGSWGALEGTDQRRSDAPKWQALMQYRAEAATQLCVEPGSTSCPGNCSDNGECLGDGTCACFLGFKGATCAEPDYVDHIDCGYKCTFGQGECALSRTDGVHRYFTCQCREGFFGKHCGQFECNRNCSWNGLCVEKDICSCFPGYAGDACEQDCGCAGHGRCAEDHTCICDAGWRPKRDGSGGCEWDCDCAAGGGTCIGPGECSCADECKYGDCANGRCLCWAGATGATCSDLDPSLALNYGSVVGMNVGGGSYWSTQTIWLDVMKQSGPWVPLAAAGSRIENPHQWGTGAPVHIDRHGWPMRLEPDQVLGKLALRDVREHAPTGVYTVTYEGDGVLEFGMDAQVQGYDKGMVKVYFRPTMDAACVSEFKAYCTDNGFFMTLVKTNPDNYLRNIKILPPGYESRVGLGDADRFPFEQRFLRDLQPFRTLRFMDWAKANKPSVRYWANRTTMATDSQAHPSQAAADNGVAVEYMVGLSNRLGADPWFTIPHTADDDYVRGMARLVRDTLRPDVRIFVEHSNEVWPEGHVPGAYATERGLALGLSTNRDTARWRYNALRSKQIWAIWQEEFGDSAAARSRLVNVLSSWIISPATTQTMLEFEDTADHTDLLAVTAYFDCQSLGGRRSNEAFTLSVEQILGECRKDLAGLQPSIAQHTAITQPLGIPVGTYEAGPSLVEVSALSSTSSSFTMSVTNKFIAVHRHPDMQNITHQWMQQARNLRLATADAPYMQFSSVGAPSQYGSWGVLEYTGQPTQTAPKYAAIQAFMNETGQTVASAQPSCVQAHNRFGYLLPLLPRSVILGAPAVTSPRGGEKWVMGTQRKVVWDAAGSDPRLPVRITLWRGTNCGPEKQLIAVLARAIRNKGWFSFTVPTNTPPGLDYFVEISGSAGSNFSAPFRIARPFRFQVGNWSACDATCGVGQQHREVVCWRDLDGHPCHTTALPQPPACSLARDCAQHSDTQDERQQVCHGGLALTYAVAASGSYEACQVSTAGCRQYRTGRMPDYTSAGKPLEDCVALTSAAPNTCPQNIAAELASTLAMCAAFYGSVPPQRQTCFERPCNAYGWVTGAWSACSESCGGGLQTRTVRCVDQLAATVNDSRCSDVPKPAVQARCNSAPCETYTWAPGAWQQCNAVCGSGHQWRTISCRSSSRLAVAASHCEAASRPESKQACAAGACPTYVWRTGSRSRCSAACGGGTSTRVVECVASADGTPAPSESSCTGPKPATTTVCNSQACVTYGWRTGPWGTCSATCGGGSCTRQVTCVDLATGAQASSLNQCAGTVPAGTGSCNTQACTSCDSDTCSGHGVCASGQCSCESGWLGDRCSVPVACGAGATLDGNGDCCDGVVDSKGVCCAGSAASLSANGTCCSSGQLDACGVCEGSGVVVDIAGVCCSGPVTAGGLCCPSGMVDDCGICDGDSSCAAVIQLTLNATGQGDLSSDFTEDWLAYQQALAGNIGTALDINANGITSVELANSGSRRLQTARQLASSVAVVISVDPSAGNASSALQGTDMLARLSTSDLGNTILADPVVDRAGTCGNDQCDVGEMCSGGAEACCPEDCPTVVSACPIPAGSTQQCGGNGLCRTGSGQCDCFTGFSGAACDECASGWIRTGSRCVYFVAPSTTPTASPTATSTTSTTSIISISTTTPSPTTISTGSPSYDASPSSSPAAAGVGASSTASVSASTPPTPSSSAGAVGGGAGTEATDTSDSADNSGTVLIAAVAAGGAAVIGLAVAGLVILRQRHKTRKTKRVANSTKAFNDPHSDFIGSNPVHVHQRGSTQV